MFLALCFVYWFDVWDVGWIDLVGVGGYDPPIGSCWLNCWVTDRCDDGCLPCVALDINEVPSIRPALTAVRPPRGWLRVMEKLG